MSSQFKPAGFDPLQHALRFHIAPRYTPGSPGLVRSAAAQQLIRRERDAYEEAISLSTNRAYDTARTLGLSGIVEERWEFEGKLHFRDLMTGETGIIRDDGKREVVGRIR